MESLLVGLVFSRTETVSIKARHVVYGTCTIYRHSKVWPRLFLQ